MFGSEKARKKIIIGMVHLRPLPGTPLYKEGFLAEILETAVRSACALENGGADACLVQTVDHVYRVDDESDPARVAAMTLVTKEIIEATGKDFRVGLQLRQNATRASLAVAKITGADFVRVGAIVGSTLTIHGLVASRPFDVMEYRTKIDAWDVNIVADIDSMHFRWHGEGMSTADIAQGAQQVGANAVAIGHPSETETLEAIASVRRKLPDLPIILAGYTNHENANRLLSKADGAFVGSCFEPDGWGGSIDVDRVKAYMGIVRGLECQ